MLRKTPSRRFIPSSSSGILASALESATSSMPAYDGPSAPADRAPEFCHPAELWTRVENPRLRSQRVQCHLCPRKCILKDGQRGFCYVRANVDNKLVLQTYGRSSGFCVDPIEKKPLKHFLPGSSILSFGTAGCNMGCKFCQNWHISKVKGDDQLQRDMSPQGVARAALELGSASVAGTYNDPIIFHEYARDIAGSCHGAGLKYVAVTAGYLAEEARAPFFDYCDAANVDLKGFTEDFYRNMCNAKLQPVLDTLCFLADKNKQAQLHNSSKKTWFELTTLVIPGLNDSVPEIERMCKWVVEHLGEFQVHHFTPFHPMWKLSDVPATPRSTLLQCRDIARRCGLKYAYASDDSIEGESTYCHNCREPLILRHRYRILERIRVTGDGRCEHCDARVPGVFESPRYDVRNERGQQQQQHGRSRSMMRDNSVPRRVHLNAEMEQAERQRQQVLGLGESDDERELLSVPSKGGAQGGLKQKLLLYLNRQGGRQRD